MTCNNKNNNNNNNNNNGMYGMLYIFCKSHNIFQMFLVPLVWFEFHIGPTVSMGEVLFQFQ